MTHRPKPRKRSGGLVGRLGKLSKTFTEPRRAGGSIDTDTGLIDPERAVLLERVAVAEMGMEREDGTGERLFAVEVDGKINTTTDEARILLLATPDAAALLVAQIVGLARGGLIGPEFDLALAARMQEATGRDGD